MIGFVLFVVLLFVVLVATIIWEAVNIVMSVVFPIAVVWMCGCLVGAIYYLIKDIYKHVQGWRQQQGK